MKKIWILMILCSIVILLLIWKVVNGDLFVKTNIIVNNKINSGIFLKHSFDGKINNNMSLQSKNFSFTFDNELTLKNFRCEVSTSNNIAYVLYFDKNSIKCNETQNKQKLKEINLYKIFNDFNKIDYKYLINNLKEGDQYSFSLYPQNSINNSGYIYKKDNYGSGNINFFIYLDNQIQKINDDTYSINKDTLLFSLSSMNKSYQKLTSEGYHPIDKEFIIIPLE